MTQEPAMLYKLIVLYMLDIADFPLTKSQIGDFMLGKDYTHFLTLQQVLGELEESGMIRCEHKGNRTHLFLTEEGKSTLSFFENRISDEIKQDFKNYLWENKSKLQNEVNITWEYHKTRGREYIAELTAAERGTPLVSIQLSVATEADAIAVCDNWQKKNQEIYRYLTMQLF
ncbi:MAG: DUF4364 family protein [Lachnospiraceae bacterium]|nr:DUF4364 family protein [Lachnospiraceae bacterium]